MTTNAVTRCLIVALSGLAAILQLKQRADRAELAYREQCRLAGYRQIVPMLDMTVHCPDGTLVLWSSPDNLAAIAHSGETCLVQAQDGSFWVPIKSEVDFTEGEHGRTGQDI